MGNASTIIRKRPIEQGERHNGQHDIERSICGAEGTKDCIIEQISGKVIIAML